MRLLMSIANKLFVQKEIWSFVIKSQLNGKKYIHITYII